MKWDVFYGFLAIFTAITIAYVWLAPHREAAVKRLVLMLMLGLIGFWQVYLLG